MSTDWRNPLLFHSARYRRSLLKAGSQKKHGAPSSGGPADVTGLLAPCEYRERQEPDGGSAAGAPIRKSVSVELQNLPGCVAGQQGLEGGAGVLALSEEDHGGDDVGLVGGFAVGVVPVAVKDAVGHFAGLAGDAGDVCGQAVHVQSLAVLGELHLLFGAFPVKELGVVGQALLLQVLEAGLVAVV